MKLIKIDDIYINVEKIIAVYPATYPDVMQTVIEIEGIGTNNHGDTPIYSQNEIRTEQPINYVIGLITAATQ